METLHKPLLNALEGIRVKGLVSAAIVAVFVTELPLNSFFLLESYPFFEFFVSSSN
jgi:hypothetical protein